MYLFKVVNGQPYLSLCIVDTAQVAPGHRKARLGLNGFHVATLVRERGRGREGKGEMEGGEGEMEGGRGYM